MNKLILHPTDMSQWHAIVNEAQAATRLVLNENTESYLVFLLMRFTQSTQLMESVMALDILEAMQVTTKRQAQLFKDLGDKSLLFCGLFPGMASRRHVRLDYYTDVGQSAYLSVSELAENDADLFAELSQQFITLQQILQAMRTQNFQETSHIIAVTNLPNQEK